MEPTSPSLLARIRREHPEWMSRLRPPDGGEAARLLRLPSADERPDVEVVIEEGEALVRVGLHEQLFVWSPGDAGEATAEVVAYVERLVRTGGPAEVLGREVEALAEDQEALLEGVDALLRERGAVADLRLAGPFPERHAELTLLLPPERGLEVTIRIGADGFEVEANGASLRLSRLDFGDDGEAWLEGCLTVLRALSSHDLEVRLRRTLSGRRVGAIRVPDGAGGGAWNGELLAYLGLGRRRSWPRWWSAT